MGDLVTLEIEAGVADVRLNRPDKYNALSNEMFAAIGEAGDRLAEEPGLRAVVLSGNGPRSVSMRRTLWHTECSDRLRSPPTFRGRCRSSSPRPIA